MIDLPPHIIILKRMKALAEAADYSQIQAGGRAMTIRHARNRKPVKGERPAISLILVGDDAEQGAELDTNAWERKREMTVDVQVDLDLPDEDSGLDDTGLEWLSIAVAIFVNSLRGPDGTWIEMLVDDVRIGELEPDDRSTPDDGRMTRALRVLYRVRVDDENVLLAAGVSA